jgi:ketosteroid isomerase-like protein
LAWRASILAAQTNLEESMTISRRRLAAAAFLGSGAAGLARTTAVAQNNDTSSTVAATVINLTKAMLSADKGKLGQYVADQLSYGHWNGVVQDKAAFIDTIVGKKTVYKSIELSNQTVAIAGDAAIVRHAWVSESGNGDGKWNEAKLGVLQVWQKQGSNWKLLARQAFEA